MVRGSILRLSAIELNGAFRTEAPVILAYQL